MSARGTRAQGHAHARLPACQSQPGLAPIRELLSLMRHLIIGTAILESRVVCTTISLSGSNVPYFLRRPPSHALCKTGSTPLICEVSHTLHLYLLCCI